MLPKNRRYYSSGVHGQVDDAHNYAIKQLNNAEAALTKFQRKARLEEIADSTATFTIGNSDEKLQVIEPFNGKLYMKEEGTKSHTICVGSRYSYEKCYPWN